MYFNVAMRCKDNHCIVLDITNAVFVMDDIVIHCLALTVDLY